MSYEAKDIIAFWYKAGSHRWFDPTPEFDAEVRDKWLAAHEAAAQGLHHDWEDNAEGALALLLLLDQFPRNMFRGTPQAFATDRLAYEVATRLLPKDFDKKFKNPWRRFFYLPFMHSENLEDQKIALRLCLASGDQGVISASRFHLELISRFGRFPHRNEALGREMTPAEQDYLDKGGWRG